MRISSRHDTPPPDLQSRSYHEYLPTIVFDDKAIWLTAIDRFISNYTPIHTIPTGEKRTGHRTYCVWASDDSRIVDQYMGLLRNDNLFPQKNSTGYSSEFGHISADGLLSIPRFGADSSAVENMKKGLVGTKFAAKWLPKSYPYSIVASLDSDEAKLWLRVVQLENEKHEQADLIGLYHDDAPDTLHVIPIEIKTRDESPDASVKVFSPICEIYGHAADQIASMIHKPKRGGTLAIPYFSTFPHCSCRNEQGVRVQPSLKTTFGINQKSIRRYRVATSKTL